jgi:hypothetical protein
MRFVCAQRGGGISRAIRPGRSLYGAASAPIALGSDASGRVLHKRVQTLGVGRFRQGCAQNGAQPLGGSCQFIPDVASSAQWKSIPTHSRPPLCRAHVAAMSHGLEPFGTVGNPRDLSQADATWMRHEKAARRRLTRCKRLAGGLGFEPRLAESESAVLPLDDPPPAQGAPEPMLNNAIRLCPLLS